MKKILISLITVSSLYANNFYLASENIDQKIYGTDKLEYYCEDGFVKVHMKYDTLEKVIPVVWENPNSNKVEKLECKDFKLWSNT